MSNVPKLRFKEFSGEWEAKKFGEICGFEQGVQVDVELHHKELSNNLVKFIRIENYTQNSNDFRFIPKELAKKKSIDSKEIAIVRYGATAGFIGRGVEGVLANNLFKLKPDKKLLDDEYLYHYLKSYKAFHFFQSEMSGGAMPALSFGIVKALKLPYSSKQEQTKIASFLTSVDTKIEQLIKKEKLLGQYKKGVMQKIFNQEIRFKADNGSEFPEWEEKKVKDIFEVTRGNVLSVSQMKQEKSDIFQYPVYSSQTKKNGLTGYYSNYLFENCITWTTDGANAGDTNFRKNKFYCTNVCGVLKSDKGYANNFIAELLNSISKKYVSYIGNPKLMNNIMANIKISIPSLMEEQTKIANFLSSIDAKIEQVSNQLNQAKQFKKALLQQMFV